MPFPKFLIPALFVTLHCSALPVSFEQRDPKHFLARVPNGFIEVGEDRVTLKDVTLRFFGRTGPARLEGIGPAAPSTYLRAGFSRTFPQFPRLAIHNLYPGVDAVFYGSGDNLEYDLNIAAGASLNNIRISVEGARAIRIDDRGNLAIGTASGVLQQMRPRVFQGSHEISARYVLLAGNVVGFRIGKHDRRSPLTVDPVLAYTKNFGSSGSSQADVVTTDAQGNIYLAGQSNSPNFPTTKGGFERKLTPPLQIVSNGGKTVAPVQVGLETSVGVVGGAKNGRLLYAATPDGIFVSGDSGATWIQTAPIVAPGLASYGRTLIVNAISLDPQDPSTLLVATNAGVFGSDSGGQDGWGERNTGLAVSASGFVMASWVSFRPVNPLVAYATTSSPSYLYASADGGNTWQLLNPTYPGEPAPPTDPFPPIAATLSPDGGTLYVVDANGTLLKSADGGQSWTKLAQGLLGAVSMQFDPSNSNTIYVFDQLGVQKSTDLGNTFSSVAEPNQLMGFAVDSSGAIYYESFSQIYVSTDGGKTFAVVPALTSSDNNNLTALAGKVYVGSVGPSEPFVMKLDPTGSNILYSTFLGGSSGDGAAGLAVDSQGNAVVVGYATSPDFPLTVSAANLPSPVNTQGFVAKLNASGTQLLYSMLLGSSSPSNISAVALDSSGAAYLTGESYGGGFPTTPKAFQPAIPTTACSREENIPFLQIDLGSAAFVSKISATGTLEYSTFLTGSCGSVGEGIAVDASGDAIVVGYTPSPDFPVSPGSYQPAFPGPVNQSPQVILNAGFITKLSPAGDKIIASSYLGGGFSTQANSVALDTADNAYVTGFTQGFAKGATPGAYETKVVDRCTAFVSIGPGTPDMGTGDAFALKLDATFSSALFLSYLGGSCNDTGNNIALDAAGNIWISGATTSPDFPLRQPFQAGGVFQSPTPGFVSELSADASQLLFSSWSSGTALALTPTAVYFAGGNGTAAFLSKIDPTITPAISIDSVTPVVAFPPPSIEPGTPGIAPGLLIQINGSNLGPTTQVNAQLDATGRLPVILANTTVYFGDVPAPLVSVQASSIVCYVPFETSSAPLITVSENGQKSNPVLTGVSPSLPQILKVFNQDGVMNSAANPAKAGSVITLYVSGLGETNPLSVDGLINTPPLAVPLAPVTVFVPGGAAITPQFVGAAPGMIAGITQINVPLPASTLTGNNAISVNSASAPFYVTK